MELAFDFDQVTTRMLIDFKRETGVSLMSLVGKNGEMDLTDVPEEAIAGLVWLSLRMSGTPEATYDDALDLPFSSLTFATAEPDPTNASTGN